MQSKSKVIFPSAPDLPGRISIFIFLATLIASLGIFWGCSTKYPLEYNTWNFTGFVLDGYSEEPLANVNIYYTVNNSEEEQEATTSSTGRFTIPGLAFGSAVFQFRFEPEEEEDLGYSDAIVTASGNQMGASGDGDLADVTQIIRLYPLNAALKGKAAVRIYRSNQTAPAESLLIRASFDNDDLEFSSSKVFETYTDEDGVFEFSRLPVAEGLKVVVSNLTYDDIPYQPALPNIPDLFFGRAVTLETIYLTPLDTAGLEAKILSSNVLSSDGFGLTGIPVNTIPYYVLDRTPDEDFLEASIEGGGDPIAQVSVSEDTVFVEPVRDLQNNAFITIILKGQDTEGNHFSLELDGDRQFKTAPGVFLVASNVMTEDGVGLTGVPVDITPYYVLSHTPDEANLEVSVEGGGDPNALVSVEGDTIFVNPVTDLEHNAFITVILKGQDKDGKHFSLEFGDDQQFKTGPGVFLLASNVLSDDGVGLTGVPVDIAPYYVMSNTPDEENLEVSLVGGGNPPVLPSVSGDTIFVQPVRQLQHNALVTVSLQGVDVDGNHFSFDFSGTRQFKTLRGIFPLASNTWESGGQVAGGFELLDTLWVQFSEELDKDISLIQWHKAARGHSLYASGENTNAEAFIKKDTLFVIPDFRVAADFGDTLSLMPSVVGKAGSRSDPILFQAALAQSNYFIKWTNTLDAFGAMREDFGFDEPVKVVPNLPVSEVTGISGVNGASAPGDLTLDNITLKGDTIIYAPSLKFKANTTYGLDFDVVFENGIKRTGVLGVTWGTKPGIRIIQTSNREGGTYKKFLAIGDALEVTFSKPVDVSGGASIPFRVNMTDVNGQYINTDLSWNAENTVVTITNTDTLPTAKLNASPAYVEGAKDTRAVDAVTFDLTTEDGQEVYQLSPEGESLEIHTEAGLTPVNTNIIAGHNPNFEVRFNEDPVSTFDSSDAVTITFNRALDKAAILAAGDSLFAGFEKQSDGTRISCTLNFSNGNKSITLVPDSALSSDTEYYIWITEIPALGISGARGIKEVTDNNHHRGRFTGRASNSRLLATSLKTAE